MAKEKERAHSILPASGAHKWLYCPPSARLEDEIPDKAGMAADEGTCLLYTSPSPRDCS